MKGFAVCFTIMSLCAVVVSGASRLAKTESGEIVELLDNGSWRAAPPQAQFTPVTGTAPSAGQNATAGGGSGGGIQQKKDTDTTTQSTLLDIMQTGSQFDFRKTTWGMSRKEVKGSENQSVLSDKGDSLIYNYSLAGIACHIVYLFAADKLVKGVYLVENDHVDPEKFYADFINLKKYLQSSFGTPVSDNQDWKNEMYRQNRAKFCSKHRVHDPAGHLAE
jgi:hypothetical protein